MSSKGTGKFTPVLALKANVGVGIQFHSFLTSALDRSEWSASYHSYTIPREIAPVSGVSRFLGLE